MSKEVKYVQMSANTKVDVAAMFRNQIIANRKKNVEKSKEQDKK